MSCKSSTSAPRVAAAAAAVIGCTLGPQLFVQSPLFSTSTSSSVALRGVSSAPLRVEAASNAVSAPLVGIGAAAGTAALLAAQQRSKGHVRKAAVAQRAFESEFGVQAPVGFWDPAGFTADGSVENFNRRRQTELKHGRISMLATMGYITPEIAGKFPGFLSPSAVLKFADVPNGLAAISKVPAAGWAQILAYMAFCEVSQDQSAGTKASTGDFDFLASYYTDARRNAELANGRLAMMAIIGMFFQDGLTGSAWGDWAFFTASPLHGLRNLVMVYQTVN
ncbi:unnamed protein product [Polarella glacialis]|uniref:Uncharacterized protein n=1 Tax=Polarella glacialis TaxID=89957 RepID=A0A813EUS4_POLGL|nr:unnamed protein product [Polarella glacialis]